jgi:hypothetical protein
MVENAFGQGIGLAGHFYGTELGVHVGHVVVEGAGAGESGGIYFVDAKSSSMGWPAN